MTEVASNDILIDPSLDLSVCLFHSISLVASFVVVVGNLSVISFVLVEQCSL